MKITFLFAFTLFLALSEAQYKPKLEVYQIRLNDDELHASDPYNSDENGDFIISKLLKIKKEKQERSVDRVKNEKMLKVIDGILNKLKTSKSSANPPRVYVISDNTIHDEDDEHEIDENSSVPININLKDIYKLLGQQPQRYKRPVLRIQGVDDRTAPPPHRYVYDSDSY